MKWILLCVVGVLAVGCSSEVKNEQPALGEIIFIQTNGATTAVATDEESLLALVKAGTEKDEAGYKTLILANKVFSVENGTKARLVKFGAASSVEIVEGKFEGRSAWIDRSWMKTSNK